MSRESFLREAVAFADGRAAEPESPREFKHCVAAGFSVICDLPQCAEGCQFALRSSDAR